MNEKFDPAGFIDCHCHILPGLDDGPADPETARQLLQQSYDEGIRTIFATSHFRPHLWKFDRSRYADALAQMQSVAAEIAPDLLLLPGNEIYCSEGIVHHLLEGDCLTLGGGDHILVEFSSRSSQDDILRYADILCWQGYRPVLAHAERFPCLKKAHAIDTLRDMGCLIQVNTDSLTGNNSFAETLFARSLLKHQQIDLIGTDCHDPAERPCRYRRCAEYIMKKCTEPYRTALLEETPRNLLPLTKEA